MLLITFSVIVQFVIRQLDVRQSSQISVVVSCFIPEFSVELVRCDCTQF